LKDHALATIINSLIHCSANTKQIQHRPIQVSLPT